MDQIPEPFGVIAATAAALRSVIKFRQPDLEVCKTRIVREAQGFPWNRQLALHRRADGKTDMLAIKAQEPEAPKL